MLLTGCGAAVGTPPPSPATTASPTPSSTPERSAASTVTPTATVAPTATLTVLPTQPPTNTPAPPQPPATPTQPPAPAKPAIPSLASATGPLSQPTIAVTGADNGKTVTAKAGDRLTLELLAPRGYDLWLVAPPDGRVLKQAVNTAATAIFGATLTAYQAAAAGSTQITASTHCNTTGCTAPPQSFAVRVVVTG